MHPTESFRRYRGALGPVAVVVLFLAGMRWSPFEPHPPPVGPSGAPIGSVSWEDDDWSVFEATVRAAAAQGVDTLPMGGAMALVGRSLVGTAYVPGTLEVEGPEQLVINFTGLDCVTFVENVWALAAVVKSGVVERIDDRAAVEAEYERVLRTLRYRNAFIDGYASRLHYFSDWIADGERKLVVEDVTRGLGGIPDVEPVNFMSTHPEAYRQLADPEVLEEIMETEARLGARGRYYLPENDIAGVADRIQDGDIIAATSTVDGLDVAHTGLALWVDGTLRLMHAPLVGEAVQISDESLAERILRLEAQDGIIVARPREPLTARARSNVEGAR
jgi:hypothetical protein